jgi:hypothetical protein
LSAIRGDEKATASRSKVRELQRKDSLGRNHRGQREGRVPGRRKHEEGGPYLRRRRAVVAARADQHEPDVWSLASFAEDDRDGEDNTEGNM